MGALCLFIDYSYGQYEEVGEEIEEEVRKEVQGKIPVIREAKLYKKDSVAVDAHLAGEILEIVVEARMYAQRPKINDVLVTGPKIGKLHYQARKTIVAGVEETEPFEVTKEHGLITFGKRKKVRELEGTLTKELFKIKIPNDKIVCGKKISALGRDRKQNRRWQSPKI